MRIINKAKTIEEFLKSREKYPILTKEVFKDLCRRILKIERKLK